VKSARSASFTLLSQGILTLSKLQLEHFVIKASEQMQHHLGQQGEDYKPVFVPFPLYCRI
jgi:hypothetical protein